MKKIFVVGLAIFAMSTSFAHAKKKSKAPEASSQSMIYVSAADKAMLKKNRHDSGIK